MEHVAAAVVGGEQAGLASAASLGSSVGFMPRDEIVAFFERYAAVRSPGSRRGIYIVGAHFLRKRKSSLLVAVGEDAAIVTRRIAARLGW